jgi:hypothetical protein
LQAEKEAAAGPFNSLTAHLNAYTQRDKALLREGAGYGKIPDLSPEEILIRRKEAAIREAARAAEEKRKEEARLAQVAREEARVAREAKEEARREAHRLALLEAARPAENDNQGGLMDIDLSGFGDIDAEIDEEADCESAIVRFLLVVVQSRAGPLRRAQTRRKDKQGSLTTIESWLLWDWARYISQCVMVYYCRLQPLYDIGLILTLFLVPRGD